MSEQAGLGDVLVRAGNALRDSLKTDESKQQFDQFIDLLYDGSQNMQNPPEALGVDDAALRAFLVYAKEMSEVVNTLHTLQGKPIPAPENLGLCAAMIVGFKLGEARMSPLDMSRMTWRCEICKEERPDAAIDVVHRPLRGMEDRFPDARFNLKYCNDRPGCVTAAHAPGPWPPEVT